MFKEVMDMIGREIEAFIMGFLLGFVVGACVAVIFYYNLIH